MSTTEAAPRRAMRTRTRTLRVRAGEPSRSGSRKAWAEAQALACSSSPRFARRASGSSRSSSWPSSRPSP